MIRIVTRMKTLWRILWLLVGFAIGALAGRAFGWEIIVPSEQDRVITSTDEDVPGAWFWNRWRDAGYAMPEVGVHFKWSDYFAKVDPATDTPQAWDLCKYTNEDGDEVGAIVMDADKEGVYLKSPLAGGSYLIHYVAFDKVDGFLRPHKVKPGSNI